LFSRLTFLTFADIIASESYQYFRDGGDGPHNVSESFKDDKAKHLICVKSSEPYERMAFLNNYQNLETIDANTCGISQIDYDLHLKGTSNSIFLKRLHTLDLSHNNITYVKRHCFYSLLFNLKTLNLSSNIITGFSPQAFHQLKVLKVLDLSKNNISFINESSFKDLHQLKNFSIANNNLLRLDTHLFANSTRLQTLNFRNNNIKLIDLIIALSVWNHLMILDLSDNGKNIHELFSVLNSLNISLPQCDEIKDLKEKCNQMFLIIISVCSLLSVATIVLTISNVCTYQRYMKKIVSNVSNQ
jgi:Leucine-rich repeat (LRR) protein